MIPMRFLFRSRWAALAWAGIICWRAASFAEGDFTHINAANSADDANAQTSALLAEGSD